MTITPAGDVGIGTVTPDTKLTISTGDNSFGLNHTNGTVNLKHIYRRRNRLSRDHNFK